MCRHHQQHIVKHRYCRFEFAVYDDPKCAAVSVDADKGDYSYDDDDNGNDINKYKRQYCY